MVRGRERIFRDVKKREREREREKGIGRDREMMRGR